MKKCAVDMTLHPMAEAILRTEYEIVPPSEIAEAEAALVYGVPEEWAGKALKLKWVGCHSVEDHFRLWAESRGITITMADSLWRTVAELTLGLAFAAARNIPQADRAVRAGHWQNHTDLKRIFSGWDFQNRTFAIMGMGQIGKQLALMLTGFRMDVVYYDICRLSPEEEERLHVRYLPLPKLQRAADFFALLIPYCEQTHGIIDRDFFREMKKGCIFVNTARPFIVDREAFVEALRDGTIGAAGLDVSWEEAMPQKEDLLSMDNVIFTPHLGGSTFECDEWLVRNVMESSPSVTGEPET